MLPNYPIKASQIVYDLRQIMTLLGGQHFKVKIGASRILEQVDTGQKTIFRCEHDSECLIKEGDGSVVYTHTITGLDDMRRFALDMEATDLDRALETGRGDTKSRLVTTTNLRYYVFKLGKLAGYNQNFQIPAWAQKSGTL